MPKFSIIVALYNQAEYLPMLIEALGRQTCKDFEVLFCDDGSGDNTRQILEDTSTDFLYRYFYQENSKSYAKAMNLGVEHAVGEYCLFIAGDSFPAEDYLEVLSEYVAAHRLVCGIRVQVDNGKGVDLDWRLKKNQIPAGEAVVLASEPWQLMTGNGLTIPTEALRLYGGWNETFVGYGGEDNELVARLYFKGYVSWSVPDLKLFHHWHKARPIETGPHNKAVELITSYAR